MLRTAIIEKSEEIRTSINSSLKELNMDMQIRCFSNQYDFLENLDDMYSSFDILLLNTTIHKEGDGIEIAQKIREKNRRIMITFITTSTDYYAQAFSVFATGYLIYPFQSFDLHDIINFYYQKSIAERRASWMVKEKGGSYKRIYCRYITYIESFNREIIIYLEDGTTIESYAKLSDTLTNLPKSLFLRCHQSFIISLYFVEQIKRDAFTVKGIDIPISRKYQSIARETYHTYIASNNV